MDEFELIDAFVAVLGERARGAGVLLGPGDDAALIEIPAGRVAVATIDTLVGDVHFPCAAPAELVAHRALGVSVSDLAAMGAEAQYVLIALTLPERGAEQWVVAFGHGAAAAAARCGVVVAGGNLARGELSVTVSAHGHVAADEALKRSGARRGDLVCVSGALGGAGVALAHADLTHPPDVATLLSRRDGDADYPLTRYYLPEPRLALGRALRSIASAAIDVSDGVVADLGHLCKASGVGAEIELERLPLVAGADARMAAVAGDDYELCFTVAPAHADRLAALPEPVAVIGTIVAGAGVRVTEVGQVVEVGAGGYRHFR
jgi:thiamine-monophosphate kinase